MAIVNLSRRITHNVDLYNRYLRSNDSLIYIRNTWKSDESGPDCLSLTVGTCWYDDAKYLEINPKRGIKIYPHHSAVIESAEEIGLPLNMYGLLFGAGSNIYKGTFISSVKIDPGFCGHLRIGIHNGSTKTIVLKPGDKLAYGIFVDTECDIEHTFLPHALTQPPISVLTIKERALRFFSQNISTVISVLSFIVATLTFCFTFLL